jgi:hypothetical protein
VLRLTLRTLLAYLDDTLEPTQARAIGQKVAESESARELIERIKQVTRRRRLTTPSATGPGKLDANTVAEYLDNAVNPEQAAEVEQICLASDVHLAEVAACHQILTLILGEPIKPPVSASQRMYGLVKGPGAIHFRKPSRSNAKAESEPYSESREIDETLRLGLPALGRKDGWRNPLILIGGGLLAAVLLVVAIFNVLSLPGPKNNGPDSVAQTNGAKDKPKTDKVEPAKDKDDLKKGDDAKPPADKSSAGPTDKASSDEKEPGKDKKSDDKKGDGAKEPVLVDVPFAPPNPRQAPIGHFVAESKDPAILLQSFPDAKQEWRRLTAKNSEVWSARPLLSLPASRGVVQTNRGVRLVLWGNVPEFISAIPGFYESLVEVYSHDVLDLDLLLQRGRVVLTSTRADRPVQIRLRFENPLIPSDKELNQRQEFFDVTLMNKGDTLLVDRWSFFAATEPFYKNPKNPERNGPTANMGCVVLDGTVKFKTGDVTYTMTAPPGPALMLWSSLTGPKGPSQMPKAPAFVLEAIPAGTDPKLRKDMIKARDYLAAQLAKSSVDVGLAEAGDSPDILTRRLVVRSLAALNDLPSLLEALDQSKYPDMRAAAVESLRYWVALARDNDYKLFDLLKEKYKSKQAEIIMEMMHNFSGAELRRPERYELLIDYLVNSNLVIRELGAWHLYRLVPAGQGIPYAADADSRLRDSAAAAWRGLIPSGQLPPTKAPTPKKK